MCRAMGDVSDRIGRPTDNGQVQIASYKKFICVSFNYIHAYIFRTALIITFLVSFVPNLFNINQFNCLTI